MTPKTTAEFIAEVRKYLIGRAMLSDELLSEALDRLEKVDRELANFGLIASAPELLEACKRLVAESSPHTVLVQEHDCVTNARCLVNAIELARASIKKAEGGK